VVALASYDANIEPLKLVVTNDNDMTAETNPIALDHNQQIPLTNPADQSALPWEPQEKMLRWIFKVTNTELPLEKLQNPADLVWHIARERYIATTQQDDWKTVTALCGHSDNDFAKALAELPLTAAEINHFRRNHRGIDTSISGKFRSQSEPLPEPLAALYALYLDQARADAEATIFLAQATGSTRVARVMADLLAIGAFASGHKSISYLTATYAVPAAFDTALLVDIANHEAASRLVLPIDHPAHLLKLTPDDISMLASGIIEQHVMSAPVFLKKAQSLAEARQDVNRFPTDQRFCIAVTEGDLPLDEVWVQRIGAAYARIMPVFVADIPELNPDLTGRRAASA
jgi:hypothetical protein